DHAPATLAMSHTGIGAAFVAGAALALWLYPDFSHRGVPFTSFALFMGVAVAVTAFPVLARILADRGLDQADVGVRARGRAVFGAFLLGVVIPHDSRLAREFARRLKDVVTVLLLPAFFALAGMRTDLGLLAGWHLWLACGVITLVATLGKFGGVALAARLTG